MPILKQVAHNSLSVEEARQAEASGIALSDFARIHDIGKQTKAFHKAMLRMSVEQPNGEKTELLLPEATLPLLTRMLTELGHGKSVVVLATDQEVTTQQAADFLKVSRPYVVKLLEEGKIPFRLVGPRRRVLVEDLLRYKEQEEAERHRGLDDLVVEAQKLGMY
jgi:excisionase family DNA binding protein